MSCVESRRKAQTLSVKFNKIRNWEGSYGEKEKKSNCEVFSIFLELYQVVENDEKIITKCKGKIQTSRLLNQPGWGVMTDTGVISVQLIDEHVIKMICQGRTFMRITMVHHPSSTDRDDIRREVDDGGTLDVPVEESDRLLGIFDLQLTEDVLSSSSETWLSRREEECDSDVSISLSVAMEEQIVGNPEQINSSLNLQFEPDENADAELERVFVFSVDLQYCKALNQIFENKQEHLFWVSCEYLGNVVQSEKLTHSSFLTGQIEGTIFSASFVFHSSYGNATNGLSKGGIGHALNIYICANDSILGHACTSIEWGEFEKDLSHKKHILKGFVHVNPFYNGSTHCETVTPLLQPRKAALRILLSFCLSNNENDTNTCYDRPSMRFQSQSQDIITERRDEPDQTKKNESKNSEKRSPSLDEMREKWNQFRYNEEMKFHKSLREKEAVLRKYLEEQKKMNDKEKEEAIKVSCTEYQKLKSRLKVALLAIEAKERKLERTFREKEATMTDKMTTLGLEQKKIKEESKRRVDAEVCLGYNF